MGGLTNSSKAGKFEPRRANCNFFRLPAKNPNMQAWDKVREEPQLERGLLLLVSVKVENG